MEVTSRDRIVEHAKRQNLDGNFTVKMLVKGAKNLSHSTGADLLADAVVSELGWNAVQLEQGLSHSAGPPVLLDAMLGRTRVRGNTNRWKKLLLSFPVREVPQPLFQLLILVRTDLRLDFIHRFSYLHRDP